MAEVSPNPADSGSASRAPGGGLDIDRLVDAQLRRHLRAGPQGDVFTIFGMVRDRVEVLATDVSAEPTLLGFVLPPRFGAVAVFASSIVARTPRHRHHQATLAVAVTRDGAVTTRVATAAEGVTRATNPQGWVIDACLRAVDRPTPAPGPAAVDLPLALWLDRLMVTIVSADEGAILDWPRAVELCPVPRQGLSLAPSCLGAAMASSTASWPAMRAAAARGLTPMMAIPPRWAAWMDDGMFARWCLGYFPDLANLRADVEFLAPPAVADQVEATVIAARVAARH